MSEPLRVIATIQAKEGCEEKLSELLRGLLAPTRGEAGCERYELHQNIDQPGLFTVVEEWRDRAALDAHAASEHVQAARDLYPGLVEGGVDLRLCRLLDA